MVQSNPDFIDAGLACAELIARPKDWINRRVETVEMLSQEETRRRVSIDFTLSASQRKALVTRHGQVVPISVLGKRPLRNFDLIAEDLSALPLLNRADNTELALLALLSAALQAAGEPSAEELAALIAELRQIVVADDDTARAALEHLVEDARAGDPIRKAIWDDDACRSLLRTFASDYVLFAALPPGGPDRRVLKFGYGEDFPLDPPWQRRRDRYAPRELWWRICNPDRAWFEINCPGAWRAASFHMEIALPEELRVAHAEIVRLAPGAESDELRALGPADERVNRAALYASEPIEPHADVRATVEIVSEREGPTTQAALTAAAVAALLWLGWVSGLDAPAPGAAVSLLLAGGAVVSGFAAATGHHILVNKLLRGRRRMMTVVVICALTASASLAMEVPSGRPLEVWLIAGILCTIVALRLGWSAVRAAR